MKREVVMGLVLGATLSFTAVPGAIGPAIAAGPGGEPVAGEASAANPDIIGHWTGAKLRCQKEEAKLVRCGTPTPFEITFTADGHGSTPEETFPQEFTWRWISPKEIVITAAGGKDEFRLFSVEREDPSLTFQAYIYPLETDPNQAGESRYIHYIFDVNRVE